MGAGTLSMCPSAFRKGLSMPVLRTCVQTHESNRTFKMGAGTSNVTFEIGAGASDKFSKTRHGLSKWAPVVRTCIHTRFLKRGFEMSDDTSNRFSNTFRTSLSTWVLSGMLSKTHRIG